MSLDSATTLCRLNQELLPEPGSPIANTTMPFGGRAGAVGTAAGGATDFFAAPLAGAGLASTRPASASPSAAPVSGSATSASEGSAALAESLGIPLGVNA